MTPADPDLAAQLGQALRAELPAAAALRRALHADPKLSGLESATTAAVVTALGAGDGTAVADTGRLIPIGGGRPIAVRAELDALPIIERTGVSWAATNGAMHACGHDIHLAAVVALGRAIAAVNPPVGVAVLLQPREEVAPSGARDVLRQRVLDRHDVRAVVGAHVQPELPGGTIAVTPGLVNASVDEFEIVVTGRGGHGGYPQTLHDPVTALCQIVVSLQQIPRRVNPVFGAVCTIGRITAGAAPNVVPSEATANGTLRLMRTADRESAIAALHEIVEHGAAMYGCRGQLRLHEGEPPMVNDPTLAAAVTTLLRAAGHLVTNDFRSFGADDFAWYGATLPSLMTFVGVPSAVGLHDPHFLPGDQSVAQIAHTLLACYQAAAYN